MVSIAAMLVTNASSATPSNSAHDALHTAHGATESEPSDFAASLRDASKPLVTEFSAGAVSAAKDSLAALQSESECGKAAVTQAVAGAQVDPQQLSTVSKPPLSAVLPGETQNLATAFGKKVKVSSDSPVPQLGKHPSVAASPAPKASTGVSQADSAKREVAKQVEPNEASVVPAQVASAKTPAAAPAVAQAATPALTGGKTSLTSDPLPQTRVVSDVRTFVQDHAHIAKAEAGKSTQPSSTVISKKHPKVETSRAVDVQSQVSPVVVQPIAPQQVVSDAPVSYASRGVADQVAPVAGRSALPSAPSSTAVGASALSSHDTLAVDQAKDTASQPGDTVVPAVAASTSNVIPAASSSIAAISSTPVVHTAAVPAPLTPHTPEGPLEQVTSKVANSSGASSSSREVASPLSAQMGTVPAHETLAATPNVLEVGVVNGAHGWVRVRAELQPASGEVTASVVVNSAASAESLHRQLPALTAYLASERLDVSSVVVNRSHSSQSTFDTNSSSSGSPSQQDAADGQPRNSGAQSLSSSWSNSQGDQEGSNAGVTHDTLSAEMNVSSGSWLSVRA